MYALKLKLQLFIERNGNSCSHEGNCSYSDKSALDSFSRGFPDAETNIVSNYASL